jgi:hypothetical protein
MKVEPGAWATATPVLSTVATCGFSLVHVSDVPTSAVPRWSVIEVHEAHGIAKGFEGVDHRCHAHPVNAEVEDGAARHRGVTNEAA